MVNSLDGQVAVITGGASGIGRATVRLLATRGARVVISDINEAAATALAAEICSAGGNAVARKCDIGQESQISSLIDDVVRTYGRLDILHNNAALLSLSAITNDVDIGTMSTELWDEVMRVTLRGTMIGCRHGINAMLKTGGGCIVNTSSNYGVSAFSRMPAYSVSKAAINMLTQNIATRYGRQGIRCNAVAPAMVYTPTLAQAIPAALIKINEDSTADGHLCEPEEVAEVVAFLSSRSASAITGQIINVDHGMGAHISTYAEARKFLGDP